MADSEHKWFEIWFSDGEDVMPTHLLLVRPNPAQAGQVLVLDPSENYKEIYRGENYEQAKVWLLEDEYSLVAGRTFPDEDTA